MAKRKAKKAARRNTGSRKAKTRSHVKLPKEAVTLVVIIRPREGQEILLEAELRALVSPTRKEEGCIVYDLHRSAEGAAGFLLHEVWASREAHTAHTKTQHFLRWNARKDALASSRDLTFWKHLI